jgi:hypothetical protein
MRSCSQYNLTNTQTVHDTEGADLLAAAFELLIVIDVTAQDGLAGTEHTLKAFTVELDALERPGRGDCGTAGVVRQQRNLTLQSDKKRKNQLRSEFATNQSIVRSPARRPRHSRPCRWSG